jgi:predicted ribosomally synthesized peptide with SipW-like signal peptide
MKRIIGSSVMLLAVLAVIVGGTGAFFSDTESSTGNVFTAGSIDLKVDHMAASYNGESCEESCVLGESNLVVNGGFETPVLSNGGYAIYADGTLTNWEVESGAGLEIQRNAAGAPQEGFQHAELDSDSSSVISQVIATVPGQKYQFSFWHSPRPNRPVSDNAIGYLVQVVSDSQVLLSGTVGAVMGGGNTGGSTNWTKYTYEFVAIDTATKIQFMDDGTSNTFGGYIDNVAVYTLNCTQGGAYENTPGGFCQLWEAKDLETETFFDFADVKPQDSGTNLISLHVTSNEAYMCLRVANAENEENDRNDAELAAGDMTTGVLEGELGEFLTVAGWYSDVNGNKAGVLFAPTLANDLGYIAFADSTTAQGPVQPGVTEYIELEWCLGEMTVTGTGAGTTVTCDGNVPDINQTQTDAFIADLQFYAVQSRNNEGFVCEPTGLVSPVPAP